MVVKDIGTWPKTNVARIISDQIVRCVGSISSNIAEGYGSGSRKEFRHCLMISRKENSESLNWLLKVRKLDYISEDRYKEYFGLISEIKKMLNSLVGKLDS